MDRYQQLKDNLVVEYLDSNGVWQPSYSTDETRGALVSMFELGVNADWEQTLRITSPACPFEDDGVRERLAGNQDNSAISRQLGG